MALFVPTDEECRVCEGCSQRKFACNCLYRDQIIAVLRGPIFKERYGELTEMCVSEDGKLRVDADKKISRIQTEATAMVNFTNKMPEYGPVLWADETFPKRHVDIFQEKDMGSSLKEFYSLSSEVLKRLDRMVWKERTKYLNVCEEEYFVRLMRSTEYKESVKREMYEMGVVVMVEYINAEARKSGQSSYDCAIHGIRSLTPFLDWLDVESLEKLVRLFEVDAKYVKRELCTVVLCWINHPQYGEVLAEVLGKRFLHCSEDTFFSYAAVMKEIFHYVCPIPGVHSTISPEVFSTLIRYHCIVLTLSPNKHINKEIIDNLKYARAFDSLPMVEKAYDSGRVFLETLSEPYLVTFMAEVGYPVSQEDPRVKKAIEKQDKFERECRRSGVPWVDVSWKHFMKKIVKEEKRWKRLAEEDPNLEERKKDMDLLGDCMMRSVGKWVWEHGHSVTSPFLVKAPKPKEKKPKPKSGRSKKNKSASSGGKEGVGKTKADGSAGKGPSSRQSCDADSASPSQKQDETPEEPSAEQTETFKVKQLQRCGFCNRQELPEAKFQKCGRCRKTRYCCKECQHQDWRTGHKDVCKPADKKSDES